MSKEKATYVNIEVGKDSPNIKGFDSWLCPWKEIGSVISNYLDGVDAGERVSLMFTIHEWTEEEREAYCEDNGIEWKR